MGRRAQLQIVLVLELLVLRPSADSAPVISTPHTTRAPSSSPRKQARPKLQRKGVSFATDDDHARSGDGIDLDKLLEGLVDRLAMWQAIAGLGDALGDLLGDGKGKGKDEDEAKEAEMDEVQRFWTDVVEE